MKTCLQCKRLVPELVTLKPGRGQSKPPQMRCPECAQEYKRIMKERNERLGKTH
jgi:DNA-directed RNA polymerase subunit RPC12/RpoP